MNSDTIDALLKPQSYQKTLLKVEEATTLPPDCYRREDFHRIEQEKVFGHAWVCVGYTCQVAKVGQMLATKVADQPIVVTRDEEGLLRAFYNVCRHRGSLLIEENSEAKRFRCPYHSWTYDLKGKLLHCPLFDANPAQKGVFNKNDYDLLSVRVASWGAFIFISLDPNAEPLSDYLGDFAKDYANFPLDELTLVRRQKYNIKANWKLIAENFLEYYHLPFVHPELCEVAAIDMHKRNQGAGMYMSFYANPLLKGNTPLDADFLPPMPKLSAEQQNSGYFPLVFPNMAMFLLPHHLFVLLVNPLNSGESEEYADLLVHKNVLASPHAEAKLDSLFAFYDMVNRQDVKAVERVQKGIRAKPYPGGRMSFRFEEPVHRFQNMCIDFITGARRSYSAD